MFFKDLQSGQLFRYIPTDPSRADGLVYRKLQKPMPIERVWRSATYNAVCYQPTSMRGWKLSLQDLSKVEVVK